MKRELWQTVAGVVAILALIAVPVVLIPISFSNVPARAEVKVVARFDEAVRTVEAAMAAHRNPGAAPGRVAPLPETSTEWIKLLNPMGRKAPGGGLAIKPEADPETGAIGVTGDRHQVTLRRPRYGELDSLEHVVRLHSASEP